MKIAKHTKYDITDLGDLIALMAANVEDAYITAGVKDYTSEDCFSKGFELAFYMFKKDKDNKISYAAEYYDHECVDVE